MGSRSRMTNQIVMYGFLMSVSFPNILPDQRAIANSSHLTSGHSNGKTSFPVSTESAEIH